MIPMLRSLLAASLLALASAGDAVAQTIYLRIHAVRVSDDDGTHAAAITPAQVDTWVEEVNAILGRSNAGIQLEANSFAAKHPAKVVVFFRHGPPDSVTGNGFAFPPQSSKGVNFVAMPGFNNTGIPVDDFNGPFAQNRLLFAHELGHYLGLGHTFPGWSDTETDTDAEAVSPPRARRRSPTPSPRCEPTS